MRIQTRIDPTGPVTFLVAGRVDAACIADFERAFGAARRLGKDIRLDLREVTLVDRPGLQYLIDLACDEVTLVNCPEYVKRWMRRDL
jgi:anti-anti-sigma regulatory factor